jgi:ABC-type multidrug transport system fused ATPase/permease subunit
MILFRKYVKKIIEEGKKWFYYSIFYYVFEGIAPMVFVWITKELFNIIAKAFAGSEIDYIPIIWLLIAYLLLDLGKSIFGYMNKILTIKLQNQLEHILEYTINERVSNAPISNLDKPDYHNHLSRVHGGLGYKFLQPIQTIFILLKDVISALTFILFLTSIHWSYALLTIIVSVPFLIIRLKLARNSYGVIFSQTPMVREANYFKVLLTSREAAKEIRLFGIAEYLLNRWSKKNLQRLNENLALQRKQERLSSALGISGSLIYIISFGTLLVLHNSIGLRIQIGSFFAIIQSIQNLFQSLNNICVSISQIYGNGLFIKDLYNFIDGDINKKNEKPVVDFPHPLQKGISVKNASFSYNNSGKSILNNISLNIKVGEKIAIVGENGSGKTTLIKCLLGLYPLNQGSILFDDTNINLINKEDVRKKFSVILQDFIQYHFSMKENIALSNLRSIDDMEKIKHIAERTGVDDFVKEFPDGYNTKLGRVLSEGEDLSGGQWQKVALARALFNDGQIIILDEPTSALDPNAELEVINSYEALIKDRTSIIISHRLAIARLVDRILVMKNGRIIEEGTHDELMRRKEEYYNMFVGQAKWYEVS